ncbi:MAG: phosphate regulon transcriptional regulatory protein PhoB [Pelagibacteraceae bacterium]|nr:phosphate regulon transcriptional regulatory protein PhoB [Pelagibacteraceae bacterium]PHX88657.1 MAG: phosphate regulon transcriptional regulatory protein PhoB [Pelagibacteraceae bacterium]
MSSHIFIVEDEPSIVSVLKYNLEKENYKVSVSDDGEEALKLIKEKNPDLVLMDWMMPNLSGVEILRNLKKDNLCKDIPIIMLTAKGEEEDKLRAFDIGADDYITKPFNQKELIARIKTVLRRLKPLVSSDIVEFSDLKIDRISKKVYRNKKEIKLGPTEFKLLDFFIKNPKRVYTREQLLNNVWGENVYVELRTIDVHIRRLRFAINLEDSKPLIRTVRSAGYSLDT